MKAQNHFSRVSPRSIRGMSLVEILAAMLIGLIGMTIIMQVYTVSEERRRTTSGTGDAQINGNIAMFTIERELRPAGFGLVTAEANTLGCTPLAYDSTRATPDLVFPTLAPVIIDVGAGGTPDTITVMYGNSWSAVSGSPFANAAVAAAPFPLKNAAGLQIGDLVIAQEGSTCSMAEITAFTVGSVNNVEHEPGATYTFTNTAGNPITLTAKHNKGGGLAAYTAAATMFSLGRNPVVKQYYIDNDRLVTRSLFPYDAAQDVDNDGWSDSEISDGIVQLKAQYGRDANANNIIEDAEWVTTTPADSAGWLEVRAVRVALLARSGQLEKTAVTPNEPEWYGGAFVMADPADGTPWENYRYRVYQTVIPLRNMIWSND